MEYHRAERQCLSSKVSFTISNICAMLGKSEYYMFPTLYVAAISYQINMQCKFCIYLQGNAKTNVWNTTRLSVSP